MKAELVQCDRGEEPFWSSLVESRQNTEAVLTIPEKRMAADTLRELAIPATCGSAVTRPVAV